MKPTAPDDTKLLQRNVSIKEPKRTAFQALLHRMYPQHNVGMPALPDGLKMKDGIVAVIDINVSLLDRIRILFSGRAEMRVLTACQNPPGQVATTSVFNATPPCQPKEPEPPARPAVPGHLRG